MRILAFIPARGGSKGIPKKNIALLNGIPLVHYTIKAAQASRYVSDIFLSSDDPDVIQSCEAVGVKVPYRRPTSLAQDDTSTIDTVLHGLDWWKNNRGYLPDALLVLQPTSPLRTTEDIDGAIEAFSASSTQSLISVHKPADHPYKYMEASGNGWNFLKKADEGITRRQDFRGEFYVINGAIYIVSTDFLLSKKTFIVENETTLYQMPYVNGLDIDEPSHLKLAEFYMNMPPITDSSH
jgi:CMP-N,N'-diacetyllegionaminic acid synthase